MARNQEHVRISEIAKVYKDAAQIFILEAVFLYLEHKQESEIEGEALSF